MNTSSAVIPLETIKHAILSIRGQKVMLDRDLAKVYGVDTRVLNQAVKRNPGRFPSEFVFVLCEEEVAGLRSQFVISNAGRGGRRYLPFAFTEHGALMAATVLNTPQAEKMSLFIIRAFVKMREEEGANAAILKRLAEVDKKLLIHDVALAEVFQKLRPLLEPPPPPAPKPEIGFHVKEDAVPYRARRPRRVASRP